MYSDINQPEEAKGVKFWQNPGNKFHILMLHYSGDPKKDPERDGAEWYKKEREGTPKADWLKEREIDFTTRAGKLIYGSEYCDYDKNIHLIDSYEIDGTGELIIAADFGQRNPTCALVGYWTRENELFIIDEYRKPALPSVSSREMFTQFEYLIGDLDGKSIRDKRQMADMAFQIKVIDPTTKSKNRSKVRDGEEIPYSVIEEFYDHGWDFEPGINDVASGITRVREYMQVRGNGRPRLYIFKDKCPDLVWELSRYRYKEHGEGQERQKNASEEPVKKDDHSVDALRYMLMTRPHNPELEAKPLNKIQKDIQSLLKPTNSMESFDTY